MKRILSSAKTIVVLLITLVLSLGFYVYMLVRPISYGMEYQVKTEYDGVAFEGAMRFYPDGTMTTRNSNFDEEMKSRYYYRDGYIFCTLPETDEDYAKEVDYINEHFDECIMSPFYCDRINAFSLIDDGIVDYSNEYVCTSAIVFAAVFGAFELALLGLVVLCLFIRRRCA